MYLDVKWSTFDDYLGSLESKIRKTVRREINKNIDCGVIIEQRKDFESISLLLSEFHSNLFYKYNNKISPFHPLFYEKLSEYMKEKVWLFIALKENKIVGFSLLLRHGKILDVFIAGFDYDHQTKTDFTYFNLIYYIPIRAAIEEGIEKIHFRGGAKNIKLRRGCKEENIEMFVKCHNRLLKFIPKWYIQIKNKYRFVRFIISKLKNILRKLKIISNFHRS
jgi:predicted N-acyltransferase